MDPGTEPGAGYPPDMMPPRWFLRIWWAIDKSISRLSGGRLTMPSVARGVRTLFLHTVGHKSGKPRRNGLYFLVEGADLVVVASNAGEDVDPAWWRNLQAHPDAEVAVGTKRRAVRARQASPDEVARLYARFVAAVPSFAEYPKRMTRPIPVVILEPR